MNEGAKLALSVQETAELLGVSVPTVYQLVGRTDFPSVKIGRRTVINRRLLQRWLDAQAGGEQNEYKE